MTLVSHRGAPAPTYTKESYMGCEHAQAAGGQSTPSQFEENTLSEVKRVIAVLSGKGGVGKSFVTGAIATELARRGNKVGILDATSPALHPQNVRHERTPCPCPRQPHAARDLRARRQGHELQPVAPKRNRSRPLAWPGYRGRHQAILERDLVAPSTTCWSICLRERVTSRSPFSNRCPSMASSSSRARKTWSR